LSKNINSNEIAIILLTFKRIKANAYKKRSKYIPIETKTRNQLNLTNEWTTTIHDKQFLMCYDCSEDKILIVATNEFLKFLLKLKQSLVMVLLDRFLKFLVSSIPYMVYIWVKCSHLCMFLLPDKR
jgi:hypothetical protein